MATAPRKITELDGDEWRAVYAAWLRNGRPYQFDRFGEFGGAIYHCPDYRTADRPDFFVHAEAGPTVFDEEQPGGPTERGFADWMTRSGYLRVRRVYKHLPAAQVDTLLELRQTCRVVALPSASLIESAQRK